MARPISRNSSAIARGALAAAVLAGSTVTLTACGEQHAKGVINVGSTAITAATISHWARILAGGESNHPGARHEAIAYLITAYWRLGEANAKGIHLTAAEINQTLAKKLQAAFPNGSTEAHEYLTAIGETKADALFEAKSELAAAKIRKELTDAAPPITSTEITAYYEQHVEHFTVPEQRLVYITNRKTRAEAEAVIRTVHAGASFATLSEPQSMVLSPETYSASRSFDANLQRAIHFAKAHTLSDPVKQHVDYYLFEVRQIIPSRRRPIAEVQASIGQTLAQERGRQALSRFVASWRARWTARTDCRSGYVVPKCRQYSGNSTTSQGL